MPKHIELFAGCGGMSLGLDAAGFELLFANELSPMAGETFAYNILNPMDRLSLSDNEEQLLVTGIANADTLKQYIEENSKNLIHFNFSDHHFFEQHELENIKKNYPEFTKWITTEKDGVRLALHKNWLIANNISVYCLPMKTKLIGSNTTDFSTTVKGFLDYFYKDENQEIENVTTEEA